MSYLRLESERETDEDSGNSRCASEPLDVPTGGSLYENGQGGADGMSDEYPG